jgi:hypothetical protein
MKIYILEQGVMGEGSNVVAIYASQSKADAEALRCNTNYKAKRQAEWNSLSKTNQRLYGPMKDYLEDEEWSVTEYEVIE